MISDPHKSQTTSLHSMDLYKTPWPAYTPPRNIDNFISPWVPSPDSFRHLSGPLRKLVDVSHRTPYQLASSTPTRNLARLIRGLCGLKSRPVERGVENRNPEKAMCEMKGAARIPLSEWRAFAAYSRPTVNGVDVHNTFTPSPTPYRIADIAVDPEEIFASLLSPCGRIHPECWVRGLQHPSLPPPPSELWSLPGPGEPLAFPWECELNYFLKPTVSGPAPVHWNIRSGTRTVAYGGPNNVTIPLSKPELAQPATHPLVTHMYISGVACTDGFPWKFMVVNLNGIRVHDVFDAIHDNFQRFVHRAEYNNWSAQRQHRAELEYNLRGGPQKGDDGLRRLDYLCGQLFFRGLEPSADRTGWTLYVGSEWS
ncbi:hypothetical protein DFH06DRAFT_576659 [Mycena polygramma]|nr:hypothetical protein DFH06DRAFT_576659 [Mycena polygramma]